MANQEMLPFERNRYYPGKLLTSADFQAEQAYFINKRLLMNGLVYGTGVLCGLGVYGLDDLSLMVESGVAVDGAGHEVVVEASQVKKLSAIAGFDTLVSGRAVLGLRYTEQEGRPTYAVNRQADGEEYEPNRITEGWTLFVANRDSLPPQPAPETDFFSVGTLYEDDDFVVQVAMPANIPRDVNVSVDVRVRCKSAAPHVLSLDCLLQAPAFTTADGTHEINIRLPEAVLAQGETTETRYWLRSGAQAEGESVLIAKPPNIRLVVDNTEKPVKEAFLLKVNLLDETVNDVVSREVGRVNLETLAAGRADYIPLALLDVQVNQSSYVIEAVTDRAVKRYLPTAAQDALRRLYTACYSEQRLAPAADDDESDMPQARLEAPADEHPQYATGLCEIPLGARPRKNEVFRSDEIMHGLGPGNVFIQVGFEYLTDDVRLDATAKNTIYGDADLFSEDQPPVPIARTAVRVMNDRGSFVVAAKLMRDTPYAVALMRWVAVRVPDEGDRTLATRIAGKSISAVQPTVLLATRESHYFEVKFRNMEPVALSYELTENDSGEITADGVYTAPGREGVYEIRIYCTELPLISTYAYAIVKKRDAEQAVPGGIGQAEKMLEEAQGVLK